MADSTAKFTQTPAQGGKADDTKEAVTRQSDSIDRTKGVGPTPKVK